MTDARALLDEGLANERGGELEHALACYRAAIDAAPDTRLLAAALTRLSHAHRKRSEWDGAIDAAHRAQEASRGPGLAPEHALALNAEATVHHARGAFELARPLYARMLETTTDPQIRGRALQNLGALAAAGGDYDGAEERFLQASHAFAAAEDRAGEAFVLNNYTALALDRGDYSAARQRALGALEAARRIGDMEVLAHARINYAEALVGLREYEHADQEATAALGFFEASGNVWRRILALRVLGDINVATGHADLAGRFYQRALADARRIGAAADVTALEERLAGLEP